MARKREKIREPLFVVERRDADGRLMFDGEQPPDAWIHGVTEWNMAQWYYARHRNGPLVDMATIYTYMLQSFGWRVRPKTW